MNATFLLAAVALAFLCYTYFGYPVLPLAVAARPSGQGAQKITW